MPASSSTRRISIESLMTVIVVIIFCAAATLTALCIIKENRGLAESETGSSYFRPIGLSQNEKQESIQEHLQLFFYVVAMGVSGLGLIALLLHKIRSIEDAYGEKQKTAETLESRMAAMESSKDGIGITDNTGTITYVNKALAQLYGYEDAGDLIGQSWRILYSKSQREWIETEVTPILKRDGHWQGHCNGLRRDGSEFHKDLTMTRLGGGGCVWLVRDYTELIEAMSLSSRRLAAIEAAGDGIGMVDRNGKLTYINRALMDLHGITRDEMNDYIGMPWENLYTVKGREDIRQHVLPALQHKRHWKGEAPIMRADDKIVIAEMSLTRLPDGGMIGTARDITEKKKTEEEKENLQKQFFQSQKMEAIGRMAGGIAHDFNNILASMLGYTEFLMEDLGVDTKQHHFARQIMHGGRQAQNLVEQILAFSRRRESARERLDLSEAVGETVTMLRATLPPTVSLDIHVNVDAAEISANPTQISQILMNLCVNARDALMEDHGVLKISVERKKENECRYPALLGNDVPAINYTPESRFVESGDEATVLLLGHVGRGRDYICVSVEDTGCGMSREVMEHIFEPFFTTKELDRGTGLGLSTVHGMMAGHQGALAVRSIVEKGTRFDLYFPAMELKHESSEGDVASGRAIAQENDGSGGRILLVEDEESVREMLSQMIKRIGYDVAQCAAGAEALDHLRENPGKYDLVLSDHMMPSMTGVEMAAEVRQDFPDLPVILISGYSPKKLEIAMAENPSIKAVLKKPIASTKLRQALQSAIKAQEKAA